MLCVAGDSAHLAWLRKTVNGVPPAVGGGRCRMPNKECNVVIDYGNILMVII